MRDDTGRRAHAPGRTARLRPAIAGLVLVWAAAPAAGQDADPAVRPDRTANGTWTIGGVSAPIAGDAGTVSVYLGHLGGLDSRFAFVEGQATVAPRTSLLVGYGYVLSEAAGGRDARAHLARVGVSAAHAFGPVDLDARLTGELLVRETGENTKRGRLRLRATVPVPGVASRLRPRLFVADELFVEEDRGLSRNRVNAGVRTTLSPLDLDLYWLREDRDDGSAVDAFVVQAVFKVGANP